MFLPFYVVQNNYESSFFHNRGAPAFVSPVPSNPFTSGIRENSMGYWHSAAYPVADTSVGNFVPLAHNGNRVLSPYDPVQGFPPRCPPAISRQNGLNLEKYPEGFKAWISEFLFRMTPKDQADTPGFLCDLCFHCSGDEHRRELMWLAVLIDNESRKPLQRDPVFLTKLVAWLHRKFSALKTMNLQHMCSFAKYGDVPYHAKGRGWAALLPRQLLNPSLAPPPLHLQRIMHKVTAIDNSKIHSLIMCLLSRRNSKQLCLETKRIEAVLALLHALEKRPQHRMYLSHLRTMLINEKIPSSLAAKVSRIAVALPARKKRVLPEISQLDMSELKPMDDLNAWKFGSSKRRTCIRRSFYKNQLFALKTYDLKMRGSGAIFLQEIQAYTKLKHANILECHGFREVGDLGHVLIEYVPGYDLESLLFRTGVQDKLPRNDGATMKKILVGICNSVSYLHSQGFVHRDIKPSNIMVNAQSFEPYLVDFGRSLDTESSPGDWSDLIAYDIVFKPPECYLKGVKIPGFLSDVWALGMTLVEFCSVRSGWLLESSDKAGKMSEITERMRRFAKPDALMLLEEWSFLLTMEYEEIGKQATKLVTILQLMLNYDYQKRPSALDVARRISSLQNAPVMFYTPETGQPAVPLGAKQPLNRNRGTKRRVMDEKPPPVKRLRAGTDSENVREKAGD